MSDLKRDPVKYIRDRIKSQYKKDTKCYICGATEELDFHHFHSVAELWKAWQKKRNLPINTVEDISIARDLFLADYLNEMLHATVTICNKHHRALHKVYGKNPALVTAPKQASWVEKQRVKALKLVENPG